MMQGTCRACGPAVFRYNGSMLNKTLIVTLCLLAVVSAACGQPRALVYDHQDKWTRSAHAAELLRKAGFRVESLPLDESPLEVGDAELILIASFASEHPEYDEYMRRHGGDLARWVSRGGVLVQLAQADQTEAVPAFMSRGAALGAEDGLQARREDDDFGEALILATDHPLLKDIQGGGDDNRRLSFHQSRTIWEAFVHQQGFEVLVAADEDAQRPALMEGALGRGRVILSAMALDKEIAPAGERTAEQDEALAQFRRVFFRNLATHVEEVNAGRAADPSVTPTPFPIREAVPGSWMLVVLPDTQLYSLHFPGMYIAQTGWIVANGERLNIRHVVHLGDIVHNNTPREWRNARDAMGLLDGLVPYALVPGNHDYGPGGSASTRETLLNEFFDFETHAAQPTFGGAMEEEQLDNTYHVFEAGGRQWIIVCLEWAPRDETVAWANAVMEQHPDHTGILVTHAYMYYDDKRYDHADTGRTQHWNPHGYRTPGGKNDGEELWEKLVRRHNFAFTLNGHVLGDGTGYLASTNDQGRTVHQILSNYQMREMGGEAYLRLMEFHPDGTTVRVRTYSPVFDKYMLAPDHQFIIRLDP